MQSREQGDADRAGTPLNRSLERGLRILRCFRPGVGALGNGELVERTGLPKATVSRLSATLVRSGFLRNDPQGGFRLAFPVLSLAHAAMLDSRVLHEAVPRMEALGATEQVNVGLTVPDELDMLYLHVAHGDRSRLTRRIDPGHRKPMESTAVGWAWLATLPPTARRRHCAALAVRHPAACESLRDDVASAAASVAQAGYCRRVGVHGTCSLAMPLVLAEGVFVLNASYSVEVFGDDHARARLVPALLALGTALQVSLGQRPSPGAQAGRV